MRKIIYHPFIVFIITIVGIIFFISLDKSSQKTDISNKNIEILEKEVNDISRQASELEERIIETESEAYKEKVIRNELLLQKPGEKVIQLPNLNNEEIEGPITSEKSKPIEEWLKLIMYQG